MKQFRVSQEIKTNIIRYGFACGNMATSNIKPIPRASGVHYNRQKGK